jgi:NADH-quinone oxidoreductase subunit M
MAGLTALVASLAPLVAQADGATDAVEEAVGAADQFPILTTLVLLPLIGAVVVALLPRSRPEVSRLVTIATMAATGVLSLWLLASFDTADAGFQFVSQHEWIERLGISWHLGVDGISLFLVVLTGLLFPLAVAAVRPKGDEKPYHMWLLALMGAVMGVFLALDLFVFFVFFEITLVPMYFLIAGWGYGERVYAATKFFLFTMAGSAFMLVAIVALVWLTADATGVTTFDLVYLAESQAVATETARWLFLAFLAGFAVKIPIFPVHTWLPDAHTQAPTAGSVILAGVLLKLGSYGLLRFGFYLFPEATVWARPALMTLGVVGIVYGAVVATMQTDLKRLVAYSSVAHMGFVVIGLAALNPEGVDGSVIQMISHGVSTGALFLLVGMIYERRHTRRIAELGGLQRSAPIMAGVFTLVMLSSVGLPGLNGFVGEFLILQGAFLAARWWAVVAAGGVILAALYLLWAYQRVFHGPANGENATMADLRWREAFVLLPFVVAIVGVGVYPKPMLERIEPAVVQLLVHVEANVDRFTIATDQGGANVDVDLARQRYADAYHGEQPDLDGLLGGDEADDAPEPDGDGDAPDEDGETTGEDDQ